MPSMYSNMPQQGTTYPTPMFPYPQITPMNPPVGYAPMNRSVLAGRMVKKLDDITYGDVPQDGSVGIFPQEDGECIYTKTYNNMGQILTQKFVQAPLEESKDEEKSEDTAIANGSEVSNQDIMNAIDNLVDFLTQSNNSKSNRSENNQNGSDSDKNSKED